VQIPKLPDVPPDQHGEGEFFAHYEDIAQDGSLKIGGMLSAIGLVSIGKRWMRTEASRSLRAQGIVPLLTRLTLQTTGGPLSVRNKIAAEGVYQLGHTRDATGDVARIVLNGHADLYAPAARTHDPQPPNAGERVHVGRAFAEHVFTRPFGPAAERKVLSLPTSEGTIVPPDVLFSRSALDTLALLPTRWLDPALALDPLPITFGLTHTDSNQHVNSLVYPQLFEDAALRRLYDHGCSTKSLLAEMVDVAFRKPCFAGERMFIGLRTFEWDGALGAIAYLGPEGCAAERAHTLCALRFRS
jgi:hypothetical protein